MSGAVHYLAMGLTGGTGSGAKLDPWPIQDFELAGNPKGAAVGDIVAVHTDGATLQSTSVAHQNPVGNLLYLPVDTNGDPENELRTWGFDSAGLGAGNAHVILGNDISYVGLKNVNSPGIGIAFSNSAKQGSLYGGVVEDSAGVGISIPNTAESNHIYDTVVRNAGSNGFAVSESEEMSSIIRCADIDSLNGSLFASGFIKNFVARNSVLATNRAALDLTGALAVIVAEHASVIVTSLNSGVIGIRNAGSTAFRALHVTNCHVTMANNGVQGAAYDNGASTSRTFFRGNGYWNATTPHANMPTTSPEFLAPTLVDPDYVNVAGEDFRPQTDMSSFAYRKAVLSEGLDWRDCGAFTSQLTGGGGGISNVGGLIL